MNKRVVTGLNTKGKSTILIQGNISEQIDLGPAYLDEIWMDEPTESNSNAPFEYSASGHKTLFPIAGNGGSAVRFATFRANDNRLLNASGFDLESLLVNESNFHTSNSIDYVFILSGELELILESESVLLKPGDVVVQRGTAHEWKVRGNTNVKIACVIVASPSYENVENQHPDRDKVIETKS